MHDIINYSTSFVLLNLEKVERKRKQYKNLNYLENEKSFLDEIKNIFHSFWRAIIWWKNKNLIKNSRHKLSEKLGISITTVRNLIPQFL